MVSVFLETLPFFLLIGLGYLAAAAGFFGREATAALTKFVFYFALSAMLFRFSANLSFEEIFNPRFISVYLSASVLVYAVVFAAARLRGRPLGECSIEAQCGVVGNIGFLGIPMLAILLGEASIAYIVMMLAVDLLCFGSMTVIMVTGSRDGRLSPAAFAAAGMGLVRNPMLVAIALGFSWSALRLPIPESMNVFLETLGNASTPCALFAIGASLAAKSAERLIVAGWLSLSKLVLHPAAIAAACLLVAPVDPYAASVMIASSALPTAGNIFILAQSYGVAPQRVSATILISTVFSVATVSAVIAWVSTFV